MILRLRYIQQFKDRHGHTRLYFRRKGCKPIRLPAETDPAFMAAYQTALAAAEPPCRVNRVPAGSLEALARSYQATAKFKQLGSSTRAVYTRIIRDLCVRHGDKPIALLNAKQVSKLVEAKADTPAAANHLLRTLRAMLRHAVKLGWIPSDPTRDVDRLKERGRGAETWTEQDVAAFEAHWPTGSRPRLALALLLYTGQRRSDVVRMGRQHVREGAIEVRQVKTGTRLFIPLHPELSAMIEAETDRLTFLMTEQGRPFTPNGFYMRFKAWSADAGLPIDRSPHGLRKAAARRLAEAGCSAHQIASITGHRTLAEVQRYTQAADQARLARDAVLHIGRPKTEQGR